MIPAINISAEMSGVHAMLDALEREKAPAAARALNGTVTTVRSLAVNDLKADYPIKVGAIRKRINLEKATKGKLQAAAVFSGARIPMFGNFGMRGLKNMGVRFSKLPWRVETADGQQVDGAMLQRAFRNRLKRGGRATVMAREGSGRYPIQVLVAPGLSRALVEKKLGAAYEAAGRARFAELYLRELQFIISKR
jgi:hypothetical protein